MATVATNDDVLAALENASANVQPVEQPVEQPMGFGEMLSQASNNFGSSARQFAADTAQPFLHPIETADSLLSLGKGIVQLAIPGEQEDEKTAKAVGAFFVDRYGSVEAAKRTFATDPVGFFGDVSMVLASGGAGLAAKTAGRANTIAQNVQRVGEVIDPINAVTKTASGIGRGASVAVPATVGLLSGTSGQSLQDAFQAGREGGERQQAFSENMRGAVDPADVVEDARGAFAQMKEDTRTEYANNKEALDLQRRHIDFFPIRQQMDELADTFDYKGFSELPEEDAAVLARVLAQVKKFESNESVHDAYGLDVLKRNIDNLYPKDLNPGVDAKIVGKARDIVKRAIVEQVPEYEALMRPYEQARKLETEMQQALSLGRTAAADTALRKLQSVMRDNVNANFGSRLRLVEKLEKAGDALLLPKLAGQDLQPMAPKGIARVAAGTNVLSQATELANPSTLALMPLTSPRLMGEAAMAGGQGVRMLNEGQQRLMNSPLMQSEGAQAVQQAAANNPTSDMTVGPLARSRAVGMTERAATEEEEVLQRLNQLLNESQARIAQ